MPSRRLERGSFEPPSRIWPAGAQKLGTAVDSEAAGLHAGVRCDRRRSTASVSSSSGVVSEMRKKPSPLGPYIEPGETTTAASSSTSSANEVEVWPSGTGAQT